MSLAVSLIATKPTRIYTANITHNLVPMAAAAGLYEALWRPEKIGVAKALDLVPLLEAGLSKLRDAPDEFRKHNPSNGWGNYENLLTFVSEYLAACQANPDANIEVSR